MMVASLIQPGWSGANGSEMYLQHLGVYAKEFGAQRKAAKVLLYFLLYCLIDALSSYTFLAVTNYSSSPDRTSS